MTIEFWRQLESSYIKHKLVLRIHTGNVSAESVEHGTVTFYLGFYI